MDYEYPLFILSTGKIYYDINKMSEEQNQINNTISEEQRQIKKTITNNSEKIDGLKTSNIVNNSLSNGFIVTDWESGAFSGNGDKTDNPLFLRTKDNLTLPKGEYILSVNNGYVGYYYIDKAVLFGESVTLSLTEHTNINFIVKREDGAEISISEIYDVKYTVTTKVSLKAELKELDNRLNSIISHYLGTKFIDGWIDGKYINLSGGINTVAPTEAVDATPGSGYRYVELEVKSGDTFIINGNGGKSPRLYALTDSNRKIYNVSKEDASASMFILQAKENGYLILNDKSGLYSYYSGRLEELLELINLIQNQDSIYSELISASVNYTGYNDNFGIWHSYGANAKRIKIQPLHRLRVSAMEGEDVMFGWLKSAGSDGCTVSDSSMMRTLVQSGNYVEVVSPKDAQYIWWTYTSEKDLNSVVDLGLYEPSQDNSIFGDIAIVANKLGAYQMNVYGGIEKGYGEITSTMAYNEGGIRVPAFFAHNMATLLVTKKYDSSIVGHSEYAVKVQIHRNIIALVSNHVSNKENGWPDSVNRWQSAYWAHSIAYCYHVMPDLFSIEEFKKIKNMVKNEADYLLTLNVDTSYYWKNKEGVELHKGDTKADECGWAVSLLSDAVILCNDSDNISAYRDKLIELSIIGWSMPSDIGKDKLINGYSLTNLNGYNYNDDGSTVNHNIIHPQYMIAFETSVLDALAIFAYKGIIAPSAMLFNKTKIAQSLHNNQYDERYSEGGGTIYQPCREDIYYPEGNDWGEMLTVTFAALDSCVVSLGIDPTSDWRQWYNLHINKVKYGQSRFTDGRIYAEGEHSYGAPGSEINASQNISVAMMLYKFPLFTKNNNDWGL